MPIIVDFVVVPLTGSSPLVVACTDLSTGSPDSWLWEFGDGLFSEEQHPDHTYLVDGLYTVKLTAYIKTSTSFIFAAPQTAVSKTAIGSSNVDAYTNFVNQSFTNLPGGQFEWNQYSLERVSSNSYEYQARKITYTPNLNAHSGKVITLNTSYESIPDIPASGVNMTYGGLLRALPDSTSRVVADISVLGGNTPTFELSDFSLYAILPDISVGFTAGWVTETVNIRAYSFIELGTHEKVGYVQVGPLCVANGWMMTSFDVIPRVPSGFSLAVVTDALVHLIARYLPEVPPKRTIWKQKYGMRYRCYPEFSLNFHGDVDQDESGETLIHTFDMTQMPASKTLVVMLSGIQCGLASASRSPLMEFDNTVV